MKNISIVLLVSLSINSFAAENEKVFADPHLINGNIHGNFGSLPTLMNGEEYDEYLDKNLVELKELCKIKEREKKLSYKPKEEYIAHNISFQQQMHMNNYLSKKRLELSSDKLFCESVKNEPNESRDEKFVLVGKYLAQVCTHDFGTFMERGMSFVGLIDREEVYQNCSSPARELSSKELIRIQALRLSFFNNNPPGNLGLYGGGGMFGYNPYGGAGLNTGMGASGRANDKVIESSDGKLRVPATSGALQE